MIDIENIVLDYVADVVYEEYPNASVYGEYVEVPKTFPCVTVVESDSSVDDTSIDCSSRDLYTRVMYSIDIYTNASTGKKEQAKAIAELVDGVMTTHGFVRTSTTRTPNVDRTIYRISMRYSGKVGSKVVDGSNAYYPIYR